MLYNRVRQAGGKPHLACSSTGQQNTSGVTHGHIFFNDAEDIRFHDDKVTRAMKVALHGFDRPVTEGRSPPFWAGRSPVLPLAINPRREMLIICSEVGACQRRVADGMPASGGVYLCPRRSSDRGMPCP